MTTLENPERLWWFSYVRNDKRSEMLGAPDRAMVERFHAHTPAGCDPSPVGEYVRADRAAEQTAAAVEAARAKFADLIENADDLADDLMGRPRASETIEALRRERDALARALAHVRGITADIDHETIVRACDDALAAGKGVG